MVEKRNRKNKVRLSDRVLGDEWSTWNGEDEDYVFAARGLFVLFSMVVTFVMEALIYGIWWLTSPRLEMIFTGLGGIVFWTISSVIVIFDLWIIMVFTSVMIERSFGPLTSEAVKYVNHLLPVVVRWGMKLGISRDKMGNSFIKVSNQLSWAIVSKMQKYKSVLVLLPRCLRSKDRIEIKKLAEKLGQKVFVVSGGEAARQRIREYMPDLIVAVACERDLMSGIQDVSARIPVLALPNRRPEGPCKNTTVDFSELSRIMERFPVSG